MQVHVASLASYPGLPSQLFSQPWPRFLPRLRKKLWGKAWVRGYSFPTCQLCVLLEQSISASFPEHSISVSFPDSIPGAQYFSLIPRAQYFSLIPRLHSRSTVFQSHSQTPFPEHSISASFPEHSISASFPEHSISASFPEHSISASFPDSIPRAQYFSLIPRAQYFNLIPSLHSLACFCIGVVLTNWKTFESGSKLNCRQHIYLPGALLKKTSQVCSNCYSMELSYWNVLTVARQQTTLLPAWSNVIFSLFLMCKDNLCSFPTQNKLGENSVWKWSLGMRLNNVLRLHARPASYKMLKQEYHSWGSITSAVPDLDRQCEWLLIVLHH